MHDIELFFSGKLKFETGLADNRIRLDFTGSIAVRENELSGLFRIFTDTRNNKGAVYFISGEAGAGKTRLLEEFRKKIFASGGTCIEGRALDRESKMPFHPLFEALSDYMRQFRHYSMECKKKYADIVQKDCRSLGRIITDFNPHTKSLLGECPEIVPLEQERAMQRFYLTMIKFILTLAETENGLALILDDMQWSDSGSIRFIEEILRNIENKPLMVICSFRESEMKESHPLKRMGIEYSFIQNMKLCNLNREMTGRLLDSILKMDQADSAIITDFILNSSGGNPLFAQEIIKELIAEGLLQKKGDIWKADRTALSAVKIPITIIDIVLKRLDAFSRDEMNFLTRASVIGKTFDIDLLAGIESRWTYVYAHAVGFGKVTESHCLVVDFDVNGKVCASDYAKLK